MLNELSALNPKRRSLDSNTCFALPSLSTGTTFEIQKPSEVTISLEIRKLVDGLCSEQDTEEDLRYNNLAVETPKRLSSLLLCLLLRETGLWQPGAKDHTSKVKLLVLRWPRPSLFMRSHPHLHPLARLCFWKLVSF